jgi:SPP1 gp7 family putative phage head morphogenesis protein
MSSFASFEQFIRHGGQASIVLSFRATEPVLELKQVRLDGATVDAFEHRLHELAAENWSNIATALARGGAEIDPDAQDVEAEVGRFTQDFSEQASVLADTDDDAVAQADIASLADWLAHQFLTAVNERRQRQLGVSHFVWRTQDDAKVRPAHAERDDRVFSWGDAFSDGLPGHGYNCRCRAEPAILDGSILLADAPVSFDLRDKISAAQADGLADAASDAVAGGVQATWSLLRFSYLGYRRLFGVSTPEEEAERLEMRESLAGAIQALADLDAETVRQLSEAFVDYFDARHADLRLLDLEYRLGLASEDALLKAYRDVAYLDAAATLGGAALTTSLARFGVGVVRLRPRGALVALRSAATRFDGMIAMRSATVDTFVARRFAELAAQGHGPGRHEGAVTNQMMVDRVLRGLDPLTGTRVDGVTGRTHLPVRTTTRITNETDYVVADAFLRRTPEYRYAREEAIMRVGQRPTVRFEASVPIEDVLGSDYADSVEGVRRIGSFQDPIGVQPIDFSGGRLVAVFEMEPGGEPLLVTMYPTGARK